MNEDFNIEDSHGVDDLFRDKLGDYTDAPSDAAWKRLNRKLNKKEFVDFVTFSKTRVSPAQLALLPLTRRSWFRVTVAASVGISALFFTGYFLARTAAPYEKSGGAGDQPATVQGPEKSFLNSNGDVTNLNGGNNQGNTYVADQFRPAGDQGTDPVNRNYPNNNLNQQNNQGSRNVPVNNDIDQQSGIANNLANDPAIQKSILNQQHTAGNDSSRYMAARVVDSIIRANAIVDSLIQVNAENTYNTTDPENTQLNDPEHPNAGSSDPIISIPSAFTPNSDNLNDVFYIDGIEYYPDNTLVVHDAHGKVVYSKKEYRGDWNAAGVPDGLYFYFLTYKNARRVNITIKGVVTIIR
jgi:gliding motility-associated-like protein